MYEAEERMCPRCCAATIVDTYVTAEASITTGWEGPSKKIGNAECHRDSG